MADTTWDEFEPVTEDHHDTDWSQFDAEPADPKALKTGVDASIAVPNLLMHTLGLGAEGSEMAQQQAQKQRDLYTKAFESFAAPEGANEGQMRQESGIPFSGTFDPFPNVDANHPGFRAFLTGALGQPPTDETAAGAAAAINAAKGFADFTASPPGLMMAGAGVSHPFIRNLAGAGLGADIASQVPEAAQQAGALSVTGTPQEKKEAYLNLANTILAPAAIAHGLYKANGVYKPKAGPEVTSPAQLADQFTPVETRPVSEPKGLANPEDFTDVEEVPATGPESGPKVDISGITNPPGDIRPPSPPAAAPPAEATPPTSTAAPEAPSLEQVHANTPEITPGNQRVRIQLADGSVVPGLFNGYWEVPGTKFDQQPSVAIAQGDKWSHGFLPEGAKILDDVPSFADWKKNQVAPGVTQGQPKPEAPAPPAANAEGLATTPVESQPPLAQPAPVSPASPDTTPAGPPATMGSGTSVANPTPPPAPAPPPVTPVTTPTEPQQEATAPVAPTLKAADEIKDWLNGNPGSALTKGTAHDIVAKHLGGTLAQGKFTAKDQSDIIELAVNRYINEHYTLFDPSTESAGRAKASIKLLQDLLGRLPTQTTRTAETDRLQQFSTPPTEAFAANWLANLTPNDVVLEPSAGIGGLAVFAKNAGARVIANELSPRRLELIKQSGLASTVLNHNGEQLHAILTPLIRQGNVGQPTAVVMNPPFSRAARNDNRNTMVGAQHVEQGLKLLPKGGRLVAIVGEGMAHDKPAFTGWWKKIKAAYNVRANVGVNGEEYRKYGTTFGNQILVIDNTGPTPEGGTVTGSVDKVSDLIPLLEKVRNDRPAVESTPAQPGGTPTLAPGATSPKPQVNAPAPPGGQRPVERPGPAAGGGGPTAQGGAGLPTVTPPPTLGAPGPGTVGKPGGTAPQGPAEPVGSTGVQPGERPSGVEVASNKPKEERALGDGIFSSYVPQKVHVEGAAKHPATLVESTAMASVEPVDPTYKPTLDKKAISYLSNEQLENIIYAGQAHEKFLPTGERQGYFIGDGCVARGTRIFNPLTGEHVAIEKLVDTQHTVLALTPSGLKPYVALFTFRKGTAALYQVSLSDGRSITVTDEHRFLTPAGWRILADLYAGDAVACTVPDSDTNSLSTRGEDDRCCSETPEDYLARCCSGRHPDDALPQSAEGSAPKSSPSLAGVLAHNPPWSRVGDSVALAGYTLPSPGVCHPAKRSLAAQAIPARAETSSQVFASAAQSLAETPLELGRCVQPKAFSHPADLSNDSGLSLLLAPYCTVPPSAGPHQHGAALPSPSERSRYTAGPKIGQFPQPYSVGQSPVAVADAEKHEPCASLINSRWHRIASITFVRVDEFFDMWVPGPENYVAEGFINHNTGVGKGSQISGILLDNMAKGRPKHLWVSAKSGLVVDAKRDVAALGANPDLVIDLGKSGGKSLATQPKGIAFASYNSLTTGFAGVQPNRPEGQAAELRPDTDPAKPSRIKRFYDWVGGKDFDGVIVLDESHYAGNAVDMKGTRGTKKSSQRALMAVDLQALFPKARIVYSSATGATQVSNLSYADRLGIWGPGTPFPNKQAFISAIQGAGLSAMEIVARDLKATGKYLARTMSFEGIKQNQLPHPLTPDQVKVYDEVSRAWQTAFQAIQDSSAQTGAANSGRAMGQITSRFWGAAQRFYNQVLTAMQTPTIIAKMKESLAAGHSPVIQIVNTNEATLNRQLAEKGAEAAEDESTDWVEDLDMSPKDILIDYIRSHYPTQMYAAESDENGNTVWRPQATADGTPIDSPEALEAKQELLDKLKLLRAPDNPLEMILNTFGPENVAEITGRTKRVVQALQPDGTRKAVKEDRSEATRKKEFNEFADDKRHVLIFSAAGGTGYTYSADRKFKNQRPRDHIGAQLGWKADDAIQGFGRTNRTNQKQVPEYWMPSTDIPGHKRFISTIMRRLSELGALTGGERKAATQEMFKASDDLETDYAQNAVYRFWQELFAGEYPELSFADVSKKMGFVRQGMDPRTGEIEEYNTLLDPTTGALKAAALPPISKFLNRVLILEKHQQEAVFHEFDKLRESLIQNAKDSGTYDPGTQTVKALAIRKLSDEVVYADPNSTAKTRLVTVESDHPVKTIPWDKIAGTGMGEASMYARNIKSGRVFALKEGPSRTLENGNVVETWRRISPTGYDIVPRNTVTTENYYGRDKNYEEMTPQDARTLWDEQLAKAPKIHTNRDTYVVGAFLPIWDRLRLGNPRIWRMTTDKGENLLGAHVPAGAVDDLRDRLGAGGETLTPRAVLNRVMDQGQSVELANGWTIKRSRVQGDYRIEVRNVQHNQMREFEQFLGGYMERINFEPRFFVPTDEDAALSSLDKILKKSPPVRNRTAPPGGAPPALGNFPKASEAQGLGEQTGPPTLEDVRRSRQTSSPGQRVVIPPDAPKAAPIIFYSGIPLPPTVDALKDLVRPLGSASKAVRAFVREAAMKQLPRISDASHLAGEAGVRSAWARDVAVEKGIKFANDVLGDLAKEKGLDLKLGAGISEDNLRHLKDRNLKLVEEVNNRDELIQEAREELENWLEAAREGDAEAKTNVNQLRQRIARLQEYTDEDAQKFQDMADGTYTFIGQPGSPFRTEADYRSFMESPQGRELLARHRALWREIKDPIYRMASDVDPDVPLEGRGLDYGARINLKPIYDEADAARTAKGGSGGGTLTKPLASLKKRNPFKLRAEGQGPAYEGSYTELMANAFKREYPVAAQHEFIQTMIDEGLAKATKAPNPEGLLLNGETTIGRKLTLRPWSGSYLQVPKSMASEYDAGIGMLADQTIPGYTALGKAMTWLSTSGIAEGSTHVANLLSEMFTGPGPTGHPLLNALLKAAGRADILYRLPWVIMRGFSNNRDEMLALMERGMAKTPYRGLLVAPFLNTIDRGMRLTMASIYDDMVKNGWAEDTETGKREFINKLGNYKKELQPLWIRILRTTHVQPFATAIHNFNVQGLRSMTGRSGVKAAGHFARLALMAETAAGLLGVAVAVGVINYLLSGRPDGPQGTRLLNVGWIGDDKKLHQFDVGALTGWSRGPRVTGLQGYLESKRQGLNESQSQMNAARSVGNAALSYVSGPLNTVATIAATGERPGVKFGPNDRHLRVAPVQPPQQNYDALKSQLAANIAAALRSTTPAADAIASMVEGKSAEDIMQRQATRYMPKTGMKTETIANLPKIVTGSEVHAYSDSLGAQARRLPLNQRWNFVAGEMNKSQVPPEMRSRIIMDLRKAGTFSYQ